MSPDREFTELYETYYPKVLQYISRIAGQKDAEDMAQDVFDKVHKGLAAFQGKAKLSTWIYRIATNVVIDRSRSAAYKHDSESVSMNDSEDHDPQGGLKDPTRPSTEQIVIQKEMRDCINEHIDNLSPEYKIVIILSELEGMSNKEIAEILGISLDNAKVRLHRARTKLKVILNEACVFYYTDQNTLACDRKHVTILPEIKK